MFFSLLKDDSLQMRMPFLLLFSRFHDANSKITAASNPLLGI